MILVELDLNKPNPNGVLAGWLYLECSSFYRTVAIHACFFQRQASHSQPGYKGYRRQTLLSQVPTSIKGSILLQPEKDSWLISFSWLICHNLQRCSDHGRHIRALFFRCYSSAPSLNQSVELKKSRLLVTWLNRYAHM